MPISALPQRSPVACALHGSASNGAPRKLSHNSGARHLHHRTFVGRMCAAPAVSAEVTDDTYTWTGEDEFDRLNDRIDAPPLPLPPIREARRVALVRHGQSTWNAQGRVQGSSNLSYLTKKGESQAETTQQLVGYPQSAYQGYSWQQKRFCKLLANFPLRSCLGQGAASVFWVQFE